MSTYKERVQAALAVIDSDFGPLQALLADDAVFRATVPPGTPISDEFRGRDAIAGYFNRLLPDVAVFVQQAEPEFIAEGNKVIVLGDDAYTLKKNSKTAARTRLREPLPIAGFYSGIGFRSESAVEFSVGKLYQGTAAKAPSLQGKGDRSLANGGRVPLVLNGGVPTRTVHTKNYGLKLFRIISSRHSVASNTVLFSKRNTRKPCL